MCPGHIHKNGQILSNSVNFLKWKTTKLSTNIGKWLLQKKIKAHYTHTKETGINSKVVVGPQQWKWENLGKTKGVGLR